MDELFDGAIEGVTALIVDSVVSSDPSHWKPGCEFGLITNDFDFSGLWPDSSASNQEFVKPMILFLKKESDLGPEDFSSHQPLEPETPFLRGA